MQHNKKQHYVDFGWLLCYCCCPPPPQLTVSVRYCQYRCIRLVVVSLIDPQRLRWFTIIVLFFALFPPLFSADCCVISIQFHPAYARPHNDWLLCVWVACRGHVLPSGGDFSVQTIVGSLVLSLGGDGDHDGRWIATATTAEGRGGIGDVVGWVWWWWDGYLNAGGHGRCGGGGVVTVGCWFLSVFMWGGRDSRRLGLTTCARAHERGFSCRS